MWVKASTGSYIDTDSGSTFRVQQTEAGTAQVIVHGQVFGSGIHVVSEEYETLEDAQQALDNLMAEQEFTQIMDAVVEAPDELDDLDELGEDE